MAIRVDMAGITAVGIIIMAAGITVVATIIMAAGITVAGIMAAVTMAVDITVVTTEWQTLR